MLLNATTQPRRSNRDLPRDAAERIRPASGLSRYWPDAYSHGDGMSMFAYVRGDPVNNTDPTGLCTAGGNFNTCVTYRADPPPMHPDIVVTGSRSRGLSMGSIMAFSGGLAVGGWGRSGEQQGGGEEIVVTAERPRNAPNKASIRRSPSFISFPGGPIIHLASAERSGDQCGTASAPWPPDRIGDVGLQGACAQHDRCYATPGTSKFGCDIRLGRDVFLACMEAHPIAPYCALMGQSYYSAVLWGGWRAYRNAQKVEKRKRP